MKFLAYPVAFPARPVDRLLIRYLAAEGIPADAAELMLYRLWRDFGSGGSDRRVLAAQGEAFTLREDPQVGLLEQSSGFTGTAGKLIDAAIRAGFLVLEGEGVGNRQLVCADFYPMNAPSGGVGARSRGAHQRARLVQGEKAKKDMAERLELWKRTGVATELEPGQQKQALYFLLCACRALHPMAMPADDVLCRAGGLVEKAWKILQAYSEDQIHATQRWLISRRKDPTIRTDLSHVVEQWEKYAEAAKRESA